MLLFRGVRIDLYIIRIEWICRIYRIEYGIVKGKGASSLFSVFFFHILNHQICNNERIKRYLELASFFSGRGSVRRTKVRRVGLSLPCIPAVILRHIFINAGCSFGWMIDKWCFGTCRCSKCWVAYVVHCTIDAAKPCRVFLKGAPPSLFWRCLPFVSLFRGVS